jgi:CHAT domain-containing protein
MQVLAGILMRRGKSPEALSLLQRAQDALDRELDDTIKGASDAQRRALLGRSNRNSRLPLTLHLQAMAGDRGAASLALRTILRQKGRALDAGHSAVELLRRRADPSDAKLLDELAAARNELAQSTLLATPLSARKDLQAKVDRLEETLGRRFSEIAAEAKPVEVEDVRAVLRPDQALVEIAAYRRLESTTWGEERYAAYVLLPNGRIEARDLGEASKIDALARRVRAAIGQGGAFHDDARALDEAVLRPIRGLLGDTRDVWLSAEGALHIVPFDALVDESDRYAIDRYRFNLVTSGRDLLRYTDTSKRAPNTAPLILAAPDFDANVVSAPTGAAHIEGVRFPALPGTDVEATRIATLMPDAQRVVGSKATKEVLVGVHGPRLLHIASHGFFLTPSAAELRTAKAESRGLTLETEAKASFVVPVDPLVRSGLALAGANRSPERALVTALEASSLDLWGTELVTLSACETGLGEVERGEGVFGLRRALVLAGAETQMMSLWKVDDDATAALMVSYYDNILKGKGRSDALREAQLSMLANPATKHPFYWAAFIVSGDDRTLDRRAPTAPREVKTAIVSQTIKRAGASSGPPPAARPRGCACDLLGVKSESPLAPVGLVAGLVVVALRRRRANDRRRASL